MKNNLGPQSIAEASWGTTGDAPHYGAQKGWDLQGLKIWRENKKKRTTKNDDMSILTVLFLLWTKYQKNKHNTVPFTLPTGSSSEQAL